MITVAYTYKHYRPIPIDSKISLSSCRFYHFPKNSNFQSKTKLKLVITILNIFKNSCSWTFFKKFDLIHKTKFNPIHLEDFTTIKYIKRIILEQSGLSLECLDHPKHACLSYVTRHSELQLA